jgi:lipopolysaccharide export system permease protein
MVLSTFLKLFLAFVLGAPLLFILGDATEKMDTYLDLEIPGSSIALSYLYGFPQFVLWALAIAALLATVFTIYPMTIRREITAAKAGGISFHRIAAPLVVAGLAVALLGLPLSDLVPVANRKAAEIRGETTGQGTIRTNLMYITDEGTSLTGRYFSLADAQITELTLQRHPSTEGESTLHIRAASALWEADRGWMLTSGIEREIFPDGRVTSSRFDERMAPEIPESPADLLESPLDEDEMTYAELTRFGERLERSGGDVGKVMTKRAQRIAIPVAAFVIVLFGAPLATSSKRGGTAYGIGVSLATTILYIMLFRLTGALGYVGKLDPMVAAWIPNLLFFAMGIVLMWRVKS